METRRQVLISLGALYGGHSAFAQAPKYPDRPLKMVVPFAAGGGTDIVARLIAQQAATYLGQTVVVENRGGAGGSVGSDAVAKSAADGYTLLMATVSTHAINPALYPKLPYDPIASFAPISLVARVGGVVVVNAAIPARTLRDLVDGMRKEPSRYSFGSQGIGGIGHLMGEMFNTLAGTKAVHVPYKGAAPALQDLIAGNIQILYDTVPALLPHIQSGAIRALAVTTPRRMTALPHVPTSAEAGFPAFLASTWNAILAPTGTPSDAIETLNKAIVKAVHEPSVRARMAELSAEPVGSSAAELLSFMRQELQIWGPVVKTSGARAE